MDRQLWIRNCVRRALILEILAIKVFVGSVSRASRLLGLWLVVACVVKRDLWQTQGFVNVERKQKGIEMGLLLALVVSLCGWAFVLGTGLWAFSVVTWKVPAAAFILMVFFANAIRQQIEDNKA